MRFICTIILSMSAVCSAAVNTRRPPDHHTLFMPDRVIIVTTEGSQQRGISWFAIQPTKTEYTYLEFLVYFADNWLVIYDLNDLAYLALFWPGHAE
jgi:hypothetical protein